jgi:uncharacterized protein YvpB
MIGILGALLAAGISLFFWGVYRPRVISVQPGSNGSVALDSEVMIQFDKPIDRSTLIPSITPDINGQWVYEDKWLGRHLFKRLRFQADRVFDPDTTYTVELKEITDIVQLAPKTYYSYQFRTAELPTISSVTPANGATAIPPKSEVSLILTGQRPAEAELEYILEPAASFRVREAEDNRSITFTPDQPLTQGTTYRLKVNRIFVVRSRMTGEIEYRAEPIQVWDSTFTVAPPPIVAAISPTGSGVLVSTPIAITFDSPMNIDSIRSHFTIDPPTIGSVNISENGKALTFQSTESLVFNTAYTATIAAGAETANGGTLPEAAVIKFTTIGPVSVAHISPADGATGIDVRSGVRVTFDQAVDHGSAEAAFAIDPAIVGTFGWADNEMHFIPAGSLNFDTSYRITLAKGIRSQSGQDSISDFATTFKTAPQTIKLAVAIDFQDKPLSCEAAALKMALAAKGVKVSENDIMAKIAVNPAARKGSVWGDPYKEFVGSINGRQNTTGYGVYWDPIAQAASTWRTAAARTGWSISELTLEIISGNAIVVWGVYTGGYQDNWQTADGKQILAWKGEHARTLIGFVGSADNPSQLILNDPVAGQIVWTKDKFLADFAKFGNAGVVVR